MPAVVADTHAILWFLTGSKKLSARARDALREASSSGDAVFISGMTLVEAIYLVEKERLEEDAVDRLETALADSDVAIEEVPVDRDIARAMRRIPRDTVPDMPDRLIAATAVCLNLPLVTRDSRIRDSGIETIW